MDQAPTVLINAGITPNAFTTASKAFQVGVGTLAFSVLGQPIVNNQELVIVIAQFAASGVVSNVTITDNDNNTYTKRAQFPNPYTANQGVEIWTTTINKQDNGLVATITYTNPASGSSMDAFYGFVLLNGQYPNTEFDSVSNGAHSASGFQVTDSIILVTDADLLIGIVISNSNADNWTDTGAPNCLAPGPRQQGGRSAATMATDSITQDNKFGTAGTQSCFFNATNSSFQQWMLVLAVAPLYISVNPMTNPIKFVHS